MRLSSFLIRPVLAAIAVTCCLGVAGCREDGTGINVSSVKFRGNESVSDDQIKSVLATTQSSRLPWGEKFYFDRSQFEADLKRIIAFYKDRGFPDATITAFDAKLNDEQTSVAVTIDIREGEPILVERIDLNGFDPVPDARRAELAKRLPLQPGRPLDSALMQAGRELGIDVLRDQGYPRPRIEVAESPGTTERQRVVTYTAQPGRIAYVGPIEINGTSSVSENIVRRQLTFRPGELFQWSRLRESQRKLYSLELFNFVNVEPVRGAGDTAVQGANEDRVPARVTVTEGKHRKVNFGVGYGSSSGYASGKRYASDWGNALFRCG